MASSKFPLLFMILLGIAFLIPSPAADARKKSYRFKTAIKKGDTGKVGASAATITDTEPDSVTLRSLFPDMRLVAANQLLPSEKPVFTGFDKRLNNSKESFFIINPSKSDIVGATICLTYHTPDGRMLHRRYATINTLIPAGETRKVYLPSWDTQRSFYYLKSETDPRRGNPFDIVLTPLVIILSQ